MFNRAKPVYSTPDTYIAYKALTKNTPVVSIENRVSFSRYCKIVNLFFKFITELILDGEEVKLPQLAGSMKIVGQRVMPTIGEDGQIKTTHLTPNWFQTKLLWERNESAKNEKRLVYNTNEHSNFTRYKLHWSKLAMNNENRLLYSFILTRDNKHAINHKVAVEHKEYRVLPKTLK